ncbi:hypothetical protein GJAV_G00051150 [Gymnothorax javanicus]|nr:hypothetical protein GJAV_G00051150 [Gymnothorax javanicus]
MSLDICLFLLIYHTVLAQNHALSGSFENDIDEVDFLNPPTEAVSGYNLHVRYSCSDSSVVHLEALVSSDAEHIKSVFKTHWSCEPGPSRAQSLVLDLPDWLVYHADWKIPESEWVFSAMLRVWISENGSPHEYDVAQARSLVLLKPLHPYSRPMKQHNLCPSWDTEMLWRIRKDTIPRCPMEEEVVHFLSDLYASTGENFGIIRTLSQYGNAVLEREREKAVFSPWCVFSIWLFLSEPCSHDLCGVLHHINSQNGYTSPSMFLTSSGKLHVQVDGVSGESSAFLTHFLLPVQKWCRITLELQSRVANVTAVCVGDYGYTAWSDYHIFREPVLLDDTDGYFVLGGGRFVTGVAGFYGPTVYYRNKLFFHREEVNILQSDLAASMTRWFHSCKEFKEELNSTVTGYLLRAQQQEEAESCVDVFSDWISRGARSLTPPQCEPWEVPAARRRRHAARLARLSVTRPGARRGQLTWVRGALYSAALLRLTQGGGPETVRRVMPLLLQAGCLGDNRALYLSSVLYSSGLGVGRKTNKARLLSLLAAQQDWRLALLRHGHLHHLSSHGACRPCPRLRLLLQHRLPDFLRHAEPVSAAETFVESIHLNNEEVLSQQTSKDGDLFRWLKLQARNGVADAEQAVARMLFWGQQGVSPDIRTAARHYERGATRLEDPTSMYNYAIVLLQGQGVDKDIPKAVKYLKKAADEDFLPAITALGWYFEQFEGDYEQAVELWERADSMGCGEAAVNLGTLHSQGLYPGKPASQYTAYTYYLKSADRGHIVGAIRLAEAWSRGIPGLVDRQPMDAVLWAKWASEQNGHLGAVLRKALDAYFRRDWFTALVYYLMAAEAGFSAAQFNVAYLCEQNPGGMLDPAFVTDCMQRYYNLSIHSLDATTYGKIRMGDLMYGSSGRGRRDVTSAAELYSEAVLNDDPQGWYSLGLLVQDGHELPASVLGRLDLWELHGADNHTVLTTLYSMCRDHRSSEAYLPCSLALFYTQMQSVWRHHASALMVSSAVVIAAFTLLMIGSGRVRGFVPQQQGL